MNNTLQEIPDFNDLLFEFRNKDYGAYQLRKRYNSVVIAGIILAVSLVSLVVILPFLISPDSDRFIRGGARYVQVSMENFKPPEQEIFIPPSAPPPVSKRIQEIVKYVPPVVVDTLLPFEKPTATMDEIISQSQIESIDISGTGIGDDIFSGQDGVGSDEPFFMVEIMPSFKGGDINKFREWVQKRTNYPQSAIDQKIQGRVYLTFIIEPNGTVSSVTIVKGVDPIIDIEAMKVIQASPRWTPGLQRGKPVRVRYSMWLNFVF